MIKKPFVEIFWKPGERLAAGFKNSINGHKYNDYLALISRSSCLVYGPSDEERKQSQALGELFLQETIKRGLLMPSLVVSFSHETLSIYRKALDEGIEKYLLGRPVKPVFRAFN